MAGDATAQSRSLRQFCRRQGPLLCTDEGEDAGCLDVQYSRTVVYRDVAQLSLFKNMLVRREYFSRIPTLFADSRIFADSRKRREFARVG